MQRCTTAIDCNLRFMCPPRAANRAAHVLRHLGTWRTQRAQNAPKTLTPEAQGSLHGEATRTLQPGARHSRQRRARHLRRPSKRGGTERAAARAGSDQQGGDRHPTHRWRSRPAFHSPRATLSSWGWSLLPPVLSTRMCGKSRAYQFAQRPPTVQVEWFPAPPTWRLCGTEEQPSPIIPCNSHPRTDAPLHLRPALRLNQ
jgi:hypothetical protein